MVLSTSLAPTGPTRTRSARSDYAQGRAQTVSHRIGRSIRELKPIRQSVAILPDRRPRSQSRSCDPKRHPLARHGFWPEPSAFTRLPTTTSRSRRTTAEKGQEFTGVQRTPQRRLLPPGIAPRSACDPFAALSRPFAAAYRRFAFHRVYSRFLLAPSRSIAVSAGFVGRPNASQAGNRSRILARLRLERLVSQGRLSEPYFPVSPGCLTSGSFGSGRTVMNLRFTQSTRAAEVPSAGIVETTTLAIGAPGPNSAI